MSGVSGLLRNNCANTNLSLELSLVKYLDRHNGRILYVNVKIPTENCQHRPQSQRSHYLLIPIGVQCPLDDRSGVNLLRVDRDNSERVWEPEDITFDQRICSDDC